MFCCDECLAVRAFPNAPRELYYGDFTEGAAHRTTAITHEAYLRDEQQLTPWIAVPGWHKACNHWDTLHVVWLGVARDTVASTIVDMFEVFKVHSGPSSEYVLACVRVRTFPLAL